MNGLFSNILRHSVDKCAEIVKEAARGEEGRPQNCNVKAYDERRIDRNSEGKGHLSCLYP